MTDLKKFNLDSKDYHHLLKEVEKVFDIRIRSSEVKNIRTFGELTQLVIAKVNLRSLKISGQLDSFNRLRDAISSSQNISKEEIQLHTELAALFPRKGRKKSIRELEFELGFNLHVLRPYLIIEAFFILLLLGGIAGLFINFIYGLEGFALLLLLINIGFRFGKEFNCKTAGDLAEKITKGKIGKPKKNIPVFTDEEITEELKFIFGEENFSQEEIAPETRP